MTSTHTASPPPPRTAWGKVTTVRPGLWRVTDARGRVRGNLRALDHDGEPRYAAERFHPPSKGFRRLGEFWSADDALDCLRYLA